MAGFFSKLFGSFGGSSQAAEPEAKSQQVGDMTVFATPVREGNQFRVSGRIEKTVDGKLMVRRFIRADIFSSEADVIETSFRKGKQIIDQHGASLFGDGEADRMV